MTGNRQYDVHMNNPYLTRSDYEAYLLGMSVEAYEASMDAEPDPDEAIEPESRRYLDEYMVSVASEQDRADLAWILDWEVFEGFAN